MWPLSGSEFELDGVEGQRKFLQHGLTFLVVLKTTSQAPRKELLGFCPGQDEVD